MIIVTTFSTVVCLIVSNRFVVDILLLSPDAHRFLEVREAII